MPSIICLPHPLSLQSLPVPIFASGNWATWSVFLRPTHECSPAPLSFLLLALHVTPNLQSLACFRHLRCPQCSQALLTSVLSFLGVWSHVLSQISANEKLRLLHALAIQMPSKNRGTYQLGHWGSALGSMSPLYDDHLRPAEAPSLQLVPSEQAPTALMPHEQQTSFHFCSEDHTLDFREGLFSHLSHPYSVASGALENMNLSLGIPDFSQPFRTQNYTHPMAHSSVPIASRCFSCWTRTQVRLSGYC